MGGEELLEPLEGVDLARGVIRVAEPVDAAGLLRRLQRLEALQLQPVELGGIGILAEGRARRQVGTCPTMRLSYEVDSLGRSAGDQQLAFREAEVVRQGSP